MGGCVFAMLASVRSSLFRCQSFTAGLRAPVAGLARSFGSGGDPRGHLNPDGTKPEPEDAEGYHDPDPNEHFPYPKIINERGRNWIFSQDPPKTSEELHYKGKNIDQSIIPFWPPHRMYIWGNYKLLMKAEYLFFYIPTIIIFGMAIPAFSTIYLAEEVVPSTMTVKVTGRQWYWVYEVESPTDDEE